MSVRHFPAEIAIEKPMYVGQQVCCIMSGWQVQGHSDNGASSVSSLEHSSTTSGSPALPTLLDCSASGTTPFGIDVPNPVHDAMGAGDGPR